MAKRAAAAAASEAPATSQAAVPAAMKSKTDIVKELIAAGVTSPTDIAAAAKDKYGVDILPNYVSMIKSGIKNAGTKGKRAPRAKLPAAATPPATTTKGGISSFGLTADLETENFALKLALKAGGIDAAIATLQRLK